MNWKDPQHLTYGGVARGDYFYKRNEIVDDILTNLKGSSVLLAAPRRVGKTSILQYIEENPVANFKFIFKDVEGAVSAQEFYDRIINMLSSELTLTEKVQAWFGRKFEDIKIGGDKWIETNETNLPKSISALLKEFDKDDKIETLVLMIDELPEVLLHEKVPREEAEAILRSLRDWRINCKKLRFVFSGSLDLHRVVEMLEIRDVVVNDLATVKCKPFTREVAREYIVWATRGATVQYDDELKGHLLSKVRYFVPYFINLMLRRVNEIARESGKPVITPRDIDAAFERVLEEDDDFFDDWEDRLKKHMMKDFEFANDILIRIALDGGVTEQEVYDLAIKHSKDDRCRQNTVKCLKDCGYVVPDSGKYQFVSPLLAERWKSVYQLSNKKV